MRKYLRLFLPVLMSALVVGPFLAQDDTFTATAYQTVNVRSEPNNQSAIIDRLAAGDTVPVDARSGTDNRWVRVLLPNNIKGWVASFNMSLSTDIEQLPLADALLVPDNVTPGVDAVVSIEAYGRVNVRSGPAITYPVVDQLNAGDIYPVFFRSNRNNDWLYIESETLSGWVAYFTVTVKGNASTLPVRVPDTAGEDLVRPGNLVEARYNIHLRDEPTLTADVFTIIPFGDLVEPIARDEDGNWLYVLYGHEEGWTLSQLLGMSRSARMTLPVYNRQTRPGTPVPTPGITPTPTLIPTAEPTAQTAD
jgi:uncharacterized protein YgiM (DUF1202 family)